MILSKSAHPVDTVGCEVKVEGLIPGLPARGYTSGVGSFFAIGDGPVRLKEVAKGFLGAIDPLEFTGVRKLGALAEAGSPLA